MKGAVGIGKSDCLAAAVQLAVDLYTQTKTHSLNVLGTTAILEMELSTDLS